MKEISDQQLAEIAEQIGDTLQALRLMLITAESCTGGWVGQVVTSISGSSHWYDRGFITYSNASKREMLGVSTDILSRFGAVSEQTARAMAEGAVNSGVGRVSLAITGIAGPGGGSEDKPVGLVWFAWAGNGRQSRTESCQFDGDRQTVRRQAVAHALHGVLRFLRNNP